MNQLNEEAKGVSNSGNSADLPSYSWTQTSEEIELKVPINVEFKLKSKDVVVNFKKRQLQVGVKGHPLVIDGELFNEVKENDSYWVIKGNSVEITLAKGNQIDMWKRLLKTDSEPNTSKINPDSSMMADFEEETRRMVEQVKLEERLKKMGFPETSIPKTTYNSSKSVPRNPFMIPDPEEAKKPLNVEKIKKDYPEFFVDPSELTKKELCKRMLKFRLMDFSKYRE